MKSKKALFQFLDQFHVQHCDATDPTYFQRNGLKAKGIGNETYGKKSCIFINIVQTKVMKSLLVQLLDNNGFNVSRTYWPESNRIKVQVSYFKGWHWDE